MGLELIVAGKDGFADAVGSIPIEQNNMEQ